MLDSVQLPFSVFSGLVDVDQWLQKVLNFYDSSGFKQIELSLTILKKYGHDCTLDNGVNCYQQGLQIADVLFQNNADAFAVAAALLLEVIYTKRVDFKSLPLGIDMNVVSILKGVEKMSIIRTLQNINTDGFQVDKYRRMLLSIIEDVRIVLVKLAERVCFLRPSFGWGEQYGYQVAEEILDIYAPLANRLGLYSIKKELEDKALFLLHPEEYRNIKDKLDSHVGGGEESLGLLIDQIKEKLSVEGIRGLVSGRVKHAYSIWKKMNQKSYGFNQLYDIRAIRILVDTTSECYQVLSMIHESWSPVQSEYADYISRPKPNGYESIHTVIQLELKDFVEIQLRTFKMHSDSEVGVAAHWRYKEGVAQDTSYEARIIWLRSLIDWQKKTGLEAANSSVQLLKESIVNERVYVFTPSGDVIDLPGKSTVLDFAYNVHTMVGHRCRGGKVNGKIVSLRYCLKTGDKVEILMNKNPSPSKDWMNKKLGYVYSAKIRSRISRWFKAQYRDEYARLGREKILSALKGKELKKINYMEVASFFNMSSELAFFAATYVGDLRFNQVINYLLDIYSLADDDIHSSENSERLGSHPQFGCSMIVIHGVDGLMSTIAGCCKPVLGDEISGYITKGRGVSIHRAGCKDFLRMARLVPERVIEVQWGRDNTAKYLVDLNIKSLGDDSMKGVYNLLSANKISIISAESLVMQPSSFYQVVVRVAVSDLKEIDFIISKIESIKSIVSVGR